MCIVHYIVHLGNRIHPKKSPMVRLDSALLKFAFLIDFRPLHSSLFGDVFLLCFRRAGAGATESHSESGEVFLGAVAGCPEALRLRESQHTLLGRPDCPAR